MSSRPGNRAVRAPSGRRAASGPGTIASFDRRQNRAPSRLRSTAAPGAAISSARRTGQPMFARRLALAIAVLAGLIGSQGPEFAQQYRQRLGGALEELNRVIVEFDAEAQRQNLTPAEGLSRLEANADPLARQRGEDMAETIDRAQRLSEQLRAIDSGGPLTRLYVVARDF